MPPEISLRWTHGWSGDSTAPCWRVWPRTLSGSILETAVHISLRLSRLWPPCSFWLLLHGWLVSELVPHWLGKHGQCTGVEFVLLASELLQGYLGFRQCKDPGGGNFSLAVQSEWMSYIPTYFFLLVWSIVCWHYTVILLTVDRIHQWTILKNHTSVAEFWN